MMEEIIIEEDGIKYKVEKNEYGNFVWYKYGTDLMHRESGPAVEYIDGRKIWYNNGEVHREGGPAMEAANGTKYWCKCGVLHREDGPAIEYSNGRRQYWINNQYLKDIKSDEELMIKLLLE